MSAFAIFNPIWAEPLAWALVHFIWQGAVIAALAACALRLMRNRAPSMRYLLSCAALILMLGAFAATFALGVRGADRSAHEPVTVAAVESGDSHRVEIPASLVRLETSDELPGRVTIQALIAKGRSLIEPHLRAMFVVWLAGFLFFSMRFLAGWAWLQFHVRRRVVKPAMALGEVMNRLCAEMGITRRVRLLVSLMAETPMALGWIKPVILLPARVIADLAPEQLRAILAHELAHIRRHDYLVNLVQSAVETLLYYHPAVWWMSDRIRVEREHCCDDIAIQHSGGRAVYARALERLETLRATPSRLAPALGGPTLLERVRRVAGVRPVTTRYRSSGPAWVVALLTLVVLAGCVLRSGTRPSEAAKESSLEQPGTPAAQPAPPPEAPSAFKTTIYKIKEQDGAAIKELILSMFPIQSGGTRIYVDGSDLILRDTPGRINEIERLLVEKGHIPASAPKDSAYLMAHRNPETGEWEPAWSPIQEGSGSHQRRLQKVIFLEHASPEGMRARIADELNLKEAGPQTVEGEDNLSIVEFSPLNALIVRYEDPEDLREVEDLVDRLDQPEVETETATPTPSATPIPIAAPVPSTAATAQPQPESKAAPKRDALVPPVIAQSENSMIVRSLDISSAPAGVVEEVLARYESQLTDNSHYSFRRSRPVPWRATDEPLRKGIVFGRPMIEKMNALERLAGVPEYPSRPHLLMYGIASLGQEWDIVLHSVAEADSIEEKPPSLSAVSPWEGMEIRSFRIREEDGPKIKALIKALIPSQSEKAQVLAEGRNLIVRDTPEHIGEIERLISSEKLLDSSEARPGLATRTFSLKSRNGDPKSPEIRTFASRMVEAIETFLYHREGKQAAAAAGRTQSMDWDTLQLTVTDTPVNLEHVQQYIESLPELRTRRLQRMYFAQKATAEEIGAVLAEVFSMKQATSVSRKGIMMGWDSEKNDLIVEVLGNVNTLILSADNPHVLQEAVDVARQLDVTRPQVKVETLFIRFAEPPEAVRSVSDPSIAIFIPRADFERWLAEGVCSKVANGPIVTMLDGIDGQFRIETGPQKSVFELTLLPRVVRPKPPALPMVSLKYHTEVASDGKSVDEPPLDRRIEPFDPRVSLVLVRLPEAVGDSLGQYLLLDADILL